jgi:HSP20 family protein
MALVRSDSFRDIDRMLQQLWAGQNGVRSMAMPMDAYRKNDSFLIRLDLPGVTADAVDLTVEDGILTIKADRPAPPTSEEIQPVIAERPFGTFVRQVQLGNGLDTENIQAEYEAGVLTVAIPVVEQAKPKRIQVNTRDDQQELST